MSQIARSTQDVSINSGALLSDNIVLTGAREIGISAPVITSSQLFLEVGNEADQYLGRLHDPRSQAAWFWNLGPGSASIVLDVLPHPYQHARIEVTNSQENLRTFTITKARG